MIRMRAQVDWTPEDQGGRRRPPSGVGRPAYAAVVRFTDVNGPWPPPEAWSLVVEKDEALSQPTRWIADIHFLVEEAPHDALRPGRSFELYEGSRCVARGQVLADSVQASGGLTVASSHLK
jgi:hypothetical protein